MAPSNAAVATVGTLSARDTELLILAMQCLVGGEPKLDYPKFATTAGLSNPKAGMDSWYRIRKKLGLIPVSSSKNTPKKEAGAADAGADAEAGPGSEPATPKRTRATKRKAAKKEEDEETPLKVEEDSSSELVEPEKKKRVVGRRRAATVAAAADAQEDSSGPL